MKERPILFSGPMGRAILSGNKTVTRRALKNQMAAGWGIADPAHPLATITSNHPKKGKFGLLIRREIWPDSGKFEHDVIPSPYGQPGDRLWVREAWAADAQVNAVAPRDLSQGEPILYPSDGAVRQTGCSMITPGKTRPSIHMPRWASRILLEITAVRVERLQDGEGETAFESRYIAEGIHRIHQGDGEYAFHPFKTEPGPGSWTNPFDAWRELWVSVNGAESWNANPWVWVVEFKQVMP